jgi:hypothetical protein
MKFQPPRTVKAASSGGIAEVYVAPLGRGHHTITLEGVSGTGTGTIEAKALGSDEFRDITDGAIDLGAPVDYTVEGALDSVRLEITGGSSPVFTLCVSAY